MTLIIAGVGRDGAVLCSDRAESNDTNFRYVEKIFPVHGEVMAYAGDVAIGEKILSQVERSEWSDSCDKKIQLVEKIVKAENKLYGKRDPVSLIMSFHDGNKPLMQVFSDDGTSFRVKTYEAIGAGDDQSEYFLRTLYRPEHDCERLAQIFSFTIQLISETAINSAVQVSQEYPPECYIIQSVRPYRYQNPYLYEMNQHKIQTLHNSINGFFQDNDILISEVIKRYW